MVANSNHHSSLEERFALSRNLRSASAHAGLRPTAHTSNSLPHVAASLLLVHHHALFLSFRVSAHLLDAVNCRVVQISNVLNQTTFLYSS
jgi:uncharacterized protein (UPF0548 family)